MSAAATAVPHSASPAIRREGLFLRGQVKRRVGASSCPILTCPPHLPPPRLCSHLSVFLTLVSFFTIFQLDKTSLPFLAFTSSSSNGFCSSCFASALAVDSKLTESIWGVRGRGVRICIPTQNIPQQGRAVVLFVSCRYPPALPCDWTENEEHQRLLMFVCERSETFEITRFTSSRLFFHSKGKYHTSVS